MLVYTSINFVNYDILQLLQCLTDSKLILGKGNLTFSSNGICIRHCSCHKDPKETDQCTYRGRIFTLPCCDDITDFFPTTSGALEALKPFN